VSAEDHKELLAEYVREVWEEGDVSAVRRYLAPGFRRHVSAVSPPLDVDGQIERLAGLRSAFPDVEVTVDEVVAEGDMVAFRSTMRGTHRGELLGIPPTQREVTVRLVDMIRVEDGRFVEQWGGPDVFDLLGQLGATFTGPGEPPTGSDS
jgi:steroid delta-isomerase-like uncharacterized protein